MRSSAGMARNELRAIQRDTARTGASSMTRRRNYPHIVLFFEEFPCLVQPFLIDAAEGLLERGLLAAVFSARKPKPSNRVKLNISRSLRKKIHYLPRGYLRYAITGHILLDFIRACVTNPLGLVSLFRAGIRLRGIPSHAFLAFINHLPMAPYLRGVLHIESSWLAQAHPELLDMPGVRTIVTFRGRDIAVRPQLDPKWRAFMQRTLFPKAARLHFVCRSLADKAKVLGASDEKCCVLNQGIDDDFFAVERMPSTSVPLIVSVGRLVWEKGYQYAIEAAALLKARGRAFHLTLIGEGPMKSALCFLIGHRALQEEVTLAGAMGPEEVREHLSQAYLFLCSSVSEGIPTILMEAQAAGLPIVTTDVGGIPECVEDETTAFCVPPYDPQALSDRIELMLDDPDLASRMGEAGRERARKLFHVEREISNWIEVYRQVMGEVVV